MAEKQQMDDFASLFLPDLLNRLDSLQEDESSKLPQLGSRAPAPPSSQHQRQLSIHSQHPQQNASPQPSTSSSGMSLVRLFEASQQTSSLESEAAFAEVNQYLQQPQGSALGGSLSTGNTARDNGLLGGVYGASNFDSGGFNDTDSASNARTRNMNMNMNMNINLDMGSNTVSHCLSPFSGLDMGHTSHYADFLPPEASYPPQQRQRQYQMGQYSQVFPANSHIQFDASSWVNGNEPMAMNKTWSGPQAGGFRVPNSSDMRAPDNHNFSWPGQRSKKDSESSKMSAEHDSTPSQPMPKKHGRGKQNMGCSSTPQITVDYSDSSFDQLVDLKRSPFAVVNSVQSSTGSPINFNLRGFLNGRLLSNDQDNYNYIHLSSGSVDPNQVYHPQVISCYRRNFINLHLHLSIDAPSAEMFVGGERILRLRSEISAITDKENPEPVALLDNEHETSKEARRPFDAMSVETIGPKHVVKVDDCRSDAFWKVKKLQFKSATANSTNLVFQTYYRFVARIVAETSSGDSILEELVSNPIIVRGRNPSFYQTKNDVLIKAKSPNIPASYNYSNLAVPLLSADHFEHDRASTSDIPSTTLVTDESLDFKTEDGSTATPLKTEDAISEEKEDVSNVHESASSSGSDAEQEQTETEKQKDDVRTSLVPNGSDLRKILDEMSEKKGNKYRYFPISSVYYLPPINVVYFPHGVHHTDAASEPLENDSKNGPGAPSPANQTGGDRKASSKVYFR